MGRTYTETEIIAADERRRKLERLTEYPEWEELKALALEDKAQHEKRLFRDFTSKGARPVNQRQIDQHIGFWEGVTAVLEAPDRISRKVELMLENAKSAQQEGDT